MECFTTVTFETFEFERFYSAPTFLPLNSSMCSPSFTFDASFREK